MSSASGHGPIERVLVARLELVRVVGGEGHQVGDPEVGRARREHIGERQGAHRRVPAGAATTDEEAFAVGVATLDQERGGVQAVVQVHDAPVAVQPLTVGAAVARGTAVVHVDHAEPPGGEELHAEIERGGVRARRPAVADHDQRRAISLGSDRVRIGRWVEERVRAQAAVGRKLDRLRDREVALLDRNAQALPQDLDRARGEVQPDHLIRFGCRPGREHDGRALGPDPGSPSQRVQRQVQVDELPRLGIDDRRVRVAVAVVVTRDAPIAQEGDRVLTHAPLRVAELRLGLEHHACERRRAHARGSTNRCGPTRTRDRPTGSTPGPRSTPRPHAPRPVRRRRAPRRPRAARRTARCRPTASTAGPTTSHANVDPSAEMRGDEKKSWPPTIVRGSAEPSVGTATSSLTTSTIAGPRSWRSRTPIHHRPSGVTWPSANRCVASVSGVIGTGAAPGSCR